MTDYIELYKNAYKLLNRRTPTLFDCGQLCSGACCQENGLGMLLFPHEETYIQTLTDEFSISDSNIMIDKFNIKLLSCSGICNRNFRPLSCRIFPLFPFLYSDDRISVEFDPRAKGTCPLLLSDLEGIYINGTFRLTVLRTAYMLKKDPLIRAFLLNMTSELETIKSFRL